jgi:hypothetical protein
MRRKVEIPRSVEWIWRAYWEIDASEWGARVPFQSMRAVLDEYGVTDREERFWLRDVWRAMAAVETEVRAEQKKRKKADDPAAGEPEVREIERGRAGRGPASRRAGR